MGVGTFITYYMASSVSGQDESNPALWLATRAGKMELSFPFGTTCRVPQEKFPPKPYNKSFIGQACLVKMAWYWPRPFFCEFMDLDSVSVHKHAKKELGQYPFILTSHLVNNPYTDNGELELTLFASTRRAVMTDMFCKLESGIKFNFSPRLFSSVIFFALMNLAKISV